MAIPSNAVVVTAMFLCAIVGYVVLTGLRVGPFVDNDEYVYGNLAQSIAAGEGSLWRGVDVGLRSLYPYVIAPAWAVADGETGFRLTQGIGVVLMCSIVWPVWLAARESVQGRLALIAPLFTMVGIWMDASARVMTEALAVPAVTWSLCLALLAVRRGSRRLLIFAVGFGIVAGLARPQAGAVIAALALALSLEVLRRPRAQWRATARLTRFELTVAWGVVALGLLAIVGPATWLLGSYSDVVGQGASAGAMLRYSADHLTDLVFVVGVVPWIAVMALALSRRAWRDPVTGPLLALAVSVTATFVLVAGWFGAGVSFRTIERYVEYAGPLMMVAVVPAVLQAGWRAAIRVALATAAVAAGIQRASVQSNEAQALHAFGRWLFGWPAVPEVGAIWPFALFLLAAGALVAGLFWLRDRPGCVNVAGATASYRTVGVTSLLVVAALGLALPAIWQWSEEHRISGAIKTTLGRIPDGLDRRITGRATMVIDTLPPTVPLWLEFFNKKIDRAVAGAPESANLAAGYGPSCPYRVRADGRFTSSGSCSPPGVRTYVFMTSTGQIPTLVGGGRASRTGLPLVYLVRGRAQLTALRQPLCDEDTGVCRPAGLTTFARRASVVTLGFIAGRSPHSVAVNGRGFVIPPGPRRVIRVRIPAGLQTTTIQGDWPVLSIDTPYLESVALQERGGEAITVN